VISRGHFVAISKIKASDISYLEPFLLLKRLAGVEGFEPSALGFGVRLLS